MLAGELDFARVPPARWDAALRAIRALGCTRVSSAVAWREHEPVRGRFEWRELPRFVAMAGERGLGVELRVGPVADLERTSGGMPDWVLAEVACQARTSRGTPAYVPMPPRAWPLPSFASAAFRAHVRAWFSAVAGVVAPLRAPAGPVVEVVASAGPPRFARLGAYDVDYHPDALAAWTAEGHGDAPRGWSAAEAARCAAWVRFGERAAARVEAELAAMLVEVGLADAGEAGGGGGGGAAVVAFGGEAWLPPADLVAEDPDRERDAALGALAGGARGLRLGGLVSRDRRYGAAIDAETVRVASDPGGGPSGGPGGGPVGGVTAAADAARITGGLAPGAAWIPRLAAALAEVDWPSLRRRADVALVACAADARFGIASSFIDPMSPAIADWLGLGPGGAAELGRDPAAIAARRWHAATCRALELAQVAYDVVGEDASEDVLAGHAAVIAPTPGRVDRALWTRLCALAARSRDGHGPRIVIGPATPSRDELDRELSGPFVRGMGRLAAASLDDLPGLAASLAQLAPPPAWRIEPPSAATVRTFADASGRVRVVFVTRGAADARTATLVGPAGAPSLRDVLTHEIVAPGAQLALRAHRAFTPGTEST